MSKSFAQSNKVETPNSKEIYQFLTKKGVVTNFSDVENLMVTNAYQSVNSDISHVYYKQTFNGIPIFNSSISVALKNGEMKTVSSNLITNLNSKKVNSKVGIQQNKIEEAAAKNLGYPLVKNEGKAVSEGKKMKSLQNKKLDFPAPKLTYFLTENNELILGYQMVIRLATETGTQTFLTIADASNGKVLKLMNTTLSCNFDHSSFANPEREIRKDLDKEENINIAMPSGTHSYKVFPLPMDSPNSGNRRIVENPADAVASPYGWHSDGTSADEFHFTGGNNTVTMYDHDSQKYLNYQDGFWPEFDHFAESNGDFNFDFPLNLDLHPYENKEAMVTNLFYMNNTLHDIFYHYGFDEVAGNFQFTNFSGLGVEGDVVISLAQTGMSANMINNAYFQLGTDGYPALMSMFLWSPFSSSAPLSIDMLEIYTNGSLKGKYKGRAAIFGPLIQSSPVYNDLALMTDTNSVGNDMYDGCDPATNPSEIFNKTAVLRRGTCNFLQKIYHAQLAGAKSVVVVNNVPGPPLDMGLAAGANPDLITIPSIMISQNDGEPIITDLKTGTLSGSIPAENTVIPMLRDSSLDNGIVSHEFGHGISSRLTGGADNWCLTNLEQMGEGWSDFFALMLTMKIGDQGTDSRGLSNYSVFRNEGDIGIRPTPYSTDMMINPATFATLETYDNTESPHRLGYVWATMLWDMNWNLIEKYGYDPDIKFGNGGNNKALKLVMDGLKLQPCLPGFVDGRDAILLADELLNKGENKCEIWKAFSKRGLGYSANQGSVEDRTDGIANFDMPPANVLDCSFMAVNESPVDLTIAQIYPNPTSGKINILSKVKINELYASIWDASGKNIQTEKLKVIDNMTSIDISDKPAGIYLLRFVTAKGNQAFKVIKK